MLVLFELLLILTITQSTRPNILFLLADDFGWGNIGYHNPENTGIVTPNMNYLVANGLELNRHYVHYVCTPTRSSMQSGRLPVHCNLSNHDGSTSVLSGVPPNFTCIGERMKTDGRYSTHFIGKWDAGSSMKEQIPFGRGYDTSFGFLTHANDYWIENISDCNGVPLIDLWNKTQPALDVVGTAYEEFMFAQEIYKHLDNAALTPEQPFFMVYASHLTHTPNQIPKEYLYSWENDENECSQHPYVVYPGFNTSDPTNYHCRSLTQSQVNLLDIIIGNITKKLIANGQWNNTLIVFSADNGGPEYLTSAASNNYPLRGAKASPWEGGIRVNAFVSGGFLPDSRRGQIENGMIHIADWYSTFAFLVGFDPTDFRAANAGLPPIDSLNVWPLISGTNKTSPRTEIPIDENVFIQNNYKYIINASIDYASWGGALWPNSSSIEHPIQGTKMNCSTGCLFDLSNDVTEHNNIINEYAEIAQKMDQRFIELKKGYYTNNEPGTPMCPNDTNMTCQCWAAFNLYQGFYGPYQVA